MQLTSFVTLIGRWFCCECFFFVVSCCFAFIVVVFVSTFFSLFLKWLTFLCVSSRLGPSLSVCYACVSGDYSWYLCLVLTIFSVCMFLDVFSPLPFNLHLCALCCCHCCFYSNGPRTISYPIQSQFSPYNFCLPLSSSHLHFRLELSWPELNWMKTTRICNALHRNLYIWMWDKQSMNRLFCTHSFWIDEWMSCVMLKIRCVYPIHTLILRCIRSHSPEMRFDICPSSASKIQPMKQRAQVFRIKKTEKTQKQ